MRHNNEANPGHYLVKNQDIPDTHINTCIHTRLYITNDYPLATIMLLHSHICGNVCMCVFTMSFKTNSLK